MAIADATTPATPLWRPALPQSSHLLLAFALALAACTSAKTDGDAEPTGAVTVTLARVVRADVPDVVETAGTVEPPPGDDVKLGALVMGRLAQVLVAEGDRVAAGQLLARVDATQLRDAVRSAEASLAQARAQDLNAAGRLERAKKLFDAGIAARQEVDDAAAQAAATRSSVSAAEAAVSTAKNQLGRGELRAPFAGVVAHVFAAGGEPVDGSGKPILEIARTKVLELRAPLPPAQSVRVHAGQRAELRVDGVEGRVFPATVIAVAPTIDPATGAAIARLRVDNADGALKGGVFARARIAADVHKNVLAVPLEALVRDEGATTPSAVETVDGGKARRRKVLLGYVAEHVAEVRSGVSEGESVIVQGAYALPDGTPVRDEAPEGDGGPAPGEK